MASSPGGGIQSDCSPPACSDSSAQRETPSANAWRNSPAGGEELLLHRQLPERRRVERPDQRAGHGLALRRDRRKRKALHLLGVNGRRPPDQGDRRHLGCDQGGRDMYAAHA